MKPVPIRFPLRLVTVRPVRISAPRILASLRFPDSSNLPLESPLAQGNRSGKTLHARSWYNCIKDTGLNHSVRQRRRAELEEVERRRLENEESHLERHR